MRLHGGLSRFRDSTAGHLGKAEHGGSGQSKAFGPTHRLQCYTSPGHIGATHCWTAVPRYRRRLVDGQLTGLAERRTVGEERLACDSVSGHASPRVWPAGREMTKMIWAVRRRGSQKVGERRREGAHAANARGQTLARRSPMGGRAPNSPMVLVPGGWRHKTTIGRWWGDPNAVPALHHITRSRPL